MSADQRKYKMAVQKIKIVDYGICKAVGNTTREIVPGSATGYFLHSDDMVFQERTEEIEPEPGMSFGISYQFVDDTEDAELIDFVCRIKHPKLVNPETGEEFTETIEEKDAWSDDFGFDFYTFEFDWELQLGEWVFEIIYKDRVMCSQTFTLLK